MGLNITIISMRIYKHVCIHKQTGRHNEFFVFCSVQTILHTANRDICTFSQSSESQKALLEAGLFVRVPSVLFCLFDEYLAKWSVDKLYQFSPFNF
jgi:hypothetical protein